MGLSDNNVRLLFFLTDTKAPFFPGTTYSVLPTMLQMYKNAAGALFYHSREIIMYKSLQAKITQHILSLIGKKVFQKELFTLYFFFWVRNKGHEGGPSQYLDNSKRTCRWDNWLNADDYFSLCTFHWTDSNMLSNDTMSFVLLLLFLFL